MTTFGAITAKLDSLLKEVEAPVKSRQPETQNEKDQEKWEDIEDEVNDYLTFLARKTKVEDESSNDPIFPSEVISSDKNGYKLSKCKSKIEENRSTDLLVPSDIISQDKNGLSNKNSWHQELMGNHTNNTKSKKKKKIPSSFQNGFSNSEDFAATKILELSKKVRELSAKLASTENKLRVAENKLISSEESRSKQSKSNVDTSQISEEKVNEYERHIKELTEKLNATNIKLCEARNQAQQQKHEMKLLQKALASEVGENVNIQTVTSDGWRGRAQQILSLQHRVNELSDKLSQTNIPIAEKSIAAMQMLEKAQDKERIANLTAELDELKTSFQEAKCKNDQSRARIKVLTNELCSLKSRYEALSMKNDEDVKLINTLTTQMTTISQKCHEREQKLKGSYEEQINAMNVEVKQERIKGEQLKKIVMDRDSKIEKLEDKLQELKQNQKTNHQERPPSSWSTFQDRPPSRQSSVVFNSDFERMRLMELITVLNKRLDEERKTLATVQDQLRQEKLRSVKLETKCNRLEFDKVGKGYRRTTSSSRSDVSKAELTAAQDRCALLEEKVLALESRVERLRKEKEEDSRIYVRMVEDARQALRDETRKHKTLSSNISLP